MPKISVVVPVYRSKDSLKELHRRLGEVLPALADDYEVLFVEDDGNDGSWAIITDLAEADSHVKGFRLNRNFGQHNALLCGIRQSKGDIVVTIDDDLQNPPEEIPKLIETLNEGHDVVYGTPERERHGLLRDLASRITKFALQSTMGAKTARSVSAFRAFRGSLRKAFQEYRGSYVSVDVLLTWGTTRFAALTVRHDPRTLGTSQYTLRKLMRHAMNMMTGFSVMPLRFASFMGLFFTFFGISILVYVLIRYFVERTSPPGFAFLASIIPIFSGAQLFALGIIGEYLARMHFRLMDRPAYLVREETGTDMP